jgi:hypothetical protein
VHEKICFSILIESCEYESLEILVPKGENIKYNIALNLITIKHVWKGWEMQFTV